MWSPLGIRPKKVEVGLAGDTNSKGEEEDDDEKGENPRES